jgi:hypothetical protein
VVDVDKRQALLERFDRWVEFSPDNADEYAARYAEEQGKERYSLDYDLQRMMEAVQDIEAIEALHVIDDLRDRLHRYIKLQRQRARLAELQLKHTKMFADSVESRRDNTEEMARLYYTTEVVDDAGKPLGPVTPTFDGLFELPETVIQWLLLEAYFFLNGIPDEAREYLETFGFLQAEGKKEPVPSESGESEPSVESPAPQNSKLKSSGSDGLRLYGLTAGYDLDDGQLTLLGFARFYEGIYGMMPTDKPDDAVINDDVRLDQWYENYQRETARKLGKSRQASFDGGGANLPQYQP